MRFRTYKNTDLTVSEVGFGLWTISTGWWGNSIEDRAIALMHKAFDLATPCFRPSGCKNHWDELSKDSRLKNRACVNVGERAKAIGSAHK
jgi:hypothetical protein